MTILKADILLHSGSQHYIVSKEDVYELIILGERISVDHLKVSIKLPANALSK